jgi:heat shock protein HslJ
MKSNLMAIGLSVGLGIGIAHSAVAQVMVSQPSSGFQPTRYNCQTREVWSLEKQRWCSQHSPLPTETPAPEQTPDLGKPIDATNPDQSDVLNQLANTEWLLEDLNGTGVMDYLQTTLRFDATSRIGGQGGCNRYFATARIEGDLLSVSAIGATKRLCPPAVMDQETRYFTALKQAQRISLDGPYLLIYSQASNQPLKFTRLSAEKKPGQP